MWGFKETTTKTYLEISRLSEIFKKKYLKSAGRPKLDRNTAAGIATTK